MEPIKTQQKGLIAKTIFKSLQKYKFQLQMKNL